MFMRLTFTFLLDSIDERCYMYECMKGDVLFDDKKTTHIGLKTLQYLRWRMWSCSATSWGCSCARWVIS